MKGIVMFFACLCACTCMHGDARVLFFLFLLALFFGDFFGDSDVRSKMGRMRR